MHINQSSPPPTDFSKRSVLRTVSALGIAPLLHGIGVASTLAASVGNAVAAPLPASQRRKLGTLEVSSIGLGCQWTAGADNEIFKDSYGSRVDANTAIGLIRRAVDQGVTLIDTAEAYGPWASEVVVGKALDGIRNRVVLETKFGWNIDLTTGKRLPGLNSRPEHIKAVVEMQLKRLKTDRIDLLYQHRVDPNVPIEDVAGAIQDLKAQGKVLHWGLSEPGANTVRRAHAVLPLTAIQNEYSIMARDPEKVILPLCEELGIGFVCWSPLAMGLLAGSVDENSKFEPNDFRSMVPWFAPSALKANMAVVNLVRRWALAKNASPAQLSLAWLLSQKPWIVPIPGTTKVAHMEDNIGGASVVMSPAEWRQFNTELNAIEVVGARLPGAVMQFSGVDAPVKK